MSLLEQTRTINLMLQQNAGKQIDFNEVSRILADVMKVNVYVASTKGKLLGLSLSQEIENERWLKVLGDAQFPTNYSSTLLQANETICNLGVDHPLSVFPDESRELFRGGVTTLVPITGNRERRGTLVLSRLDGEFTEDDLVLAEYSATIIAMEILRTEMERNSKDARDLAEVKMAINTLSYSEQAAVVSIFDELNGDEGVLVASKIADAVGITRSVIVNALRKLESASIITSKSLGMKGTYIKIINPKFQEEFTKTLK